MIEYIKQKVEQEIRRFNSIDELSYLPEENYIGIQRKKTNLINIIFSINYVKIEKGYI